VLLDQTFSKVKSATYTKDRNLRVVAVSNKFHVLTLVFRMDGNQSEVRFLFVSFFAERLIANGLKYFSAKRKQT